MTQTYNLAGRSMHNAVNEVRHRWHQVLEQCGVTITVLFIDDIDEETGESRPVLKCHGYPAAATIAVTPLKQRVLGIADALMVLDSATWHALDEDERMALIDHELKHLQVRAAERGMVGLTEDGKIDRSARLDDHRRPVLKMRKHDWQLGGFRDVAERHKLSAPEVRAARRFREPGGQYAWDFGGARIADDGVAGDCEVSLHVDGQPDVPLGTVDEIMARTAEHAAP